MIAHGSANVMREKLFTQSDGYMTHICQDCGLIAVANLDGNQYRCPNDQTCKGSTIGMIEIPYAAKLLFQELMAMQIAPRLMTSLPGDWRLFDQ